MPLICKLVDSDGEVLDEVADGDDLLHRLLPSPSDESYHCLRFVDWYGDTVFNRAQADRALVELDRLNGAVTKAPERQLLKEIERLIRQCRDGVHLYVKFCGD